MYKIFADDLCIYDDLSNLTEYKLVNPIWRREDNTAGTLTFTMTQSNIGYSVVERLSSRIKIFKRDEMIWEGRILSEQRNFRKERVITCEGILACLNDTIQPQRELINPTVKTFLNTILSYHNSHVASDKQFLLGNVTVTTDMIDESGDDEYDTDVYIYTNFDTTFNCIAEKLINKSTDPNNDKKQELRGHLRIRYENDKRYLDYLKDYPTSSTQIIEFGRNLMDFVANYDESEFCTVLIPLGERYEEGDVDGLEGYLDITDVNGGHNYIYNQSAVDAYGWIERVQHFDTITDDEELLSKAREFLSDVQFGKMKLTVTAVDLSSLNINESEIEFLSNVRVKSNPHGLDKFFPVTLVEIPLDNPGNTKYSLGLDDEVSSISTYSNSISSNIRTVVFPEIRYQVNQTATELIKSATSGYITITKTRENTQELYITDTADYTHCNRMWRWNINGLGYSNDGGRTFGLAMTMDGAINANYIKTGTLDTNLVNIKSYNESGTMEIRSGSIYLYSGEGYGSSDIIGHITLGDVWGGQYKGLILGGKYSFSAEKWSASDAIALNTKEIWIATSDGSAYWVGYDTDRPSFDDPGYWALCVKNAQWKRCLTNFRMSMDEVYLRSMNGKLQVSEDYGKTWRTYDGSGAWYSVLSGYSWNYETYDVLTADSFIEQRVHSGLIID